MVSQRRYYGINREVSSRTLPSDNMGTHGNIIMYEVVHFVKFLSLVTLDLDALSNIIF